jgi:hypothetical protein
LETLNLLHVRWMSGEEFGLYRDREVADRKCDEAAANGAILAEVIGMRVIE